MIPIAELERFVGVDSGTDTELLIDLEARAVAWFESRTNRFFRAVEEHTETFPGSGTVRLWLSDTPVSIDSVHVQDHEGADQTEIQAGDDDGFVIRRGALHRKGGHIWEADREYVVVYQRGYTQDAAASEGVTPADVAAPDDVRGAVTAIVGAWYMGGERSASGLSSESIGDYSYSRPTSVEALAELVPGLEDTLDFWRRGPR